MKKILLKFDKRGYEKALKLINDDINVYNSLCATIKKNTDLIDITPENISLLLSDPKGFIFDLVTDKDQINFKGLPINKAKAIEIIDFPDNFNTIIKASETAKTKLAGSSYVIDEVTDIDKVDLTAIDFKDNLFSLSETYANDLKSDFEVYTRNEKQETALNAVNALIKSISELRSLGLINIEYLEGLYGVKTYDNKLVLDVDQIIRLR